MKKIFLFFILTGMVFAQVSIKERIESKILKEYSFEDLKIKISNTLPFIVEKRGKELFSGCYWGGQGCIKENGKTKHTFEGWQFSDLKGKVKGEIISETPLTIKIDTREEAKKQKEPVGFYEEITFVGKTIKVKYEFEINKETKYGVRIYIGFHFNPEILNKGVNPFIDNEKAIYDTKLGPVIISYKNFSPDRYCWILWKHFRVFASFPDGFKKGEIRKGEITISLP